MRALELSRAELERTLAERTSEAEAAKDRLRVVAREAAHRFGNLFATLQAVARRTAGETTNVEVYVEALIGRIAAMGSALRQVTTEDWAVSVDFGHIVETQLAAYHETYAEQIEVRGPGVLVRTE
ncbi:HWE histidine kinase domain-containing protein [Salinarimonas chemoclinalis]|uniref:HWE histidine kinase domain-containing protein n=1 Tax=Salinarimonas chemoclinalis TaxID=3241599 RepID=UPI003557AD4D